MFLKFSFLGGFGEQGRSCLFIETDGLSVIVDCGIKKVYAEYYGYPPLIELIDPSEVDCVVISHQHEGHTAFVPALVRRGFNGPIYATPPVLDFSRKYWLRWVKIFHEDGRQFFDERDVEKTCALAKPLPYFKEVDLGGIELTLYPSGHALGSAIVRLSIEGLEIVDLADITIGNAVPLDPYLDLEADVLVVNAAYGDAVLPRKAQELRFLRVVKAHLEKGGKVLVPATAIGRAQKTLWVLRKHWKMLASLRPRVLVHESVREGINTILKYSEYVKTAFTDTARELLEPPFEYFSEVDAIEGTAGPAIIVAPDLMLVRGPSLAVFEKIRNDPKSCVVFTGYLAPGTLGRKLAESAGAGALVHKGKTVKFECKVYRVPLKMHLDLAENFYVMEKVLKERFKMVLLHHGEEPKSTRLALRLMERLGTDRVFVPRPGSSLCLEV